MTGLFRTLLRFRSELSSIGGCALLLLCSARSIAAPVNFSETISGDLSQVPLAGFALDVGTNTIAGSTHFGVNVPGHLHYDSDFDGFAFDLPTGMQIVSISLSSVTSSYNALTATSDMRFCRGVGDCGPGLVDLLGTQSLNYFGAGPTLMTFGVPGILAPGNYSVLAANLGISALDPMNSQESWASDYVWSINVASIPEPGVMWLIVSGMLPLLQLQRKRFRNSSHSR